MHVCPECGKSMATAGGLEIHMEMVHAPEPEPEPEPELEPELAMVGAGAPVPAAGSWAGAGPAPEYRAHAPARPAGATPPLQMPTFLRRFDSTVPVTALLVIAMFVAGITAALGRNSAGDKTAAQVQSGSPTPAAAAPVAPVDAAADQRLAQSLVLDRNDLPDGWEVAPHQTDSADAQSEREEAVCLGLPDPAATKSAEMYGPDGTANVSQISTAALVTRTEQQASAYVTAEAGPKSSACAKEGLTKAFARGGITVRDIGVGRFTVSTGNVRNVAIHTELAVSRGGQAGVIYADVVFMQQRRVVGQALFISSGSPFPNDVEQTIVTRFAHKIANV